MLENLSKGHKLLVVSDTPMNKTEAYEPVVRELDAISEQFDKIFWIGFDTKTKFPAKTPDSKKIKLIPMPSCGGLTILSKLKILLYYPVYLATILKHRTASSYVHSRAPSHPALIAMVLSRRDRKRIYWHKYAGSWVDSNAPFFYRYQRSLLRAIRNSRVFGTINGRWPGQESHLITFENPCISEEELIRARIVAAAKDFSGRLSILFVGALSPFKGVIQLIEALQDKQNSVFEELIIAGDGILRQEVESMAKTSPIPVKVLGYLNRSELEKCYSAAHIIALPSLSEGFPKVVAEGCAFGCIPLVTDVSSIGQYVKDGKNGILIENNSAAAISSGLSRISATPALAELSLEASRMADVFTYEYFAKRLKEQILER